MKTRTRPTQLPNPSGGRQEGADGSEKSQARKDGRRLVLMFGGEESPVLDEVRFRPRESAAFKILTRCGTENSFRWDKFPQAFSLFFLGYLIAAKEEASKPFRFGGENRKSAAATLGDGIHQTTTAFHKLFERGLREVFGGDNDNGKANRDRRIWLRQSDYLPAGCVEVFWEPRGEIPLTEVDDLRRLAKRIHSRTHWTELTFEPTPPSVPLGPDEKDDRKNVVIDPHISAALLAGRSPSLLECVKATRTCLLPNRKKCQPICSGWSYNHFFGISSVLFVRSPAREQPVLLWYPRAPRDGIPELRRGRSILFHASFTFAVRGEPSPADLWVDLADKDRERAPEEFVRMRGGMLLKLITYKVKVPPEVEGTCQPLGVISRDLRETEERRVYTQYVFLTKMYLPKATTIEELKSVVASFETPKESPVSPCLENLQPKFFLSPPPGLTMDYLALCALRSGKKMMQYEHSQFARNFAIL